MSDTIHILLNTYAAGLAVFLVLTTASICVSDLSFKDGLGRILLMSVFWPLVVVLVTWAYIFEILPE